MAWSNRYSQPAQLKLTTEELYGPDPYDVNFCLPIDFNSLENERVKLSLFIPRLHAKIFYDTLIAHPELYRYIPFSVPKSLEELLHTFEVFFRRNTATAMLAIFDKSRPSEDFKEGSFAGIFGFINTVPQNLSTEIGYIVILPSFQRSHVLSNAVGLLLHYCLNRPIDSPKGLGLRRVQWMANEHNAPSVKAAERMGFRHEGIIRWNWVLPQEKTGNKPREGDQFPANPGRNTAALSLCWDDWDSGTKEKVRAIMDRKA